MKADCSKGRKGSTASERTCAWVEGREWYVLLHSSSISRSGGKGSALQRFPQSG
jgi:hypothetical protein